MATRWYGLSGPKALTEWYMDTDHEAPELCGYFQESGALYLTLRLYKDSYYEVFGPKDHIIQGFWAILSLRVNLPCISPKAI